MKWTLDEPSYGDMIRVKVGALYHYGIFVSDDEVIQFGLAPNLRSLTKDNEIEVCTSDIEAFLAGGFLERAELDRKETKKRRSPEDTVVFARSRLGERGYNILYNNCEHFAYDCVLGERYCSQSESVRALFRALPLLNVYVAKIPEQVCYDTLYPAARNDEVAAVSNETVKKHKYCVWKLLEYGLERSLGLKIKELDLRKNENGRWTTSACEFSISHSANAVAVAISRKPVGIDIELKKPQVHEDRFAEHILTEAELRDYRALPAAEKNDYLLQTWTAKESAFKRTGGASYRPTEITLNEKERYTTTLPIDDEIYFLSVVSESIHKLKLFDNVDLKKI